MHATRQLIAALGFSVLSLLPITANSQPVPDAAFDICLGPFHRYDINGDGAFNVSDPVAHLQSLFLPGNPPIQCLDLGDANDDGVQDVTDVIYAMTNLFSFGPDIPEPALPGAAGHDEDCTDFVDNDGDGYINDGCRPTYIREHETPVPNAFHQGIASSDGGYIFVGYEIDPTVPPGSPGELDLAITKVDELGQLEWSLGSNVLVTGVDHYGLDVVQTNDNNYVVLSRIGSDFLELTKIDQAGSTTPIWSELHDYPQPGVIDLGTLAKGINGEFFIVGRGQDPNGASEKIYILKTDSFGAYQSEMYIGSNDWQIEETGYDIAQANDSSLYIAGEKRQPDPATGLSRPYFYVVKASDTGTPLWERTIDGMFYGYAYSIWPTSDGGCIASGSLDTEAFVIKFDTDGNTEWEQTYEEYTWWNGPALDVREVPLGGYAFIMDNRLVRIDETGKMTFYRDYGVTGVPGFLSLDVTFDSNFLLTGSAYYYGSTPIEHYGLAAVVDPFARIAQCADSIDNNGDGLIDLADPGCTSSLDGSEGP